MDEATDQAMEQEFLESPAPEPTDAAPKEAESIEDLPEWAQQALAKARREAARYRTKAKAAPEADALRTELRREVMTEVASARIEAALTGLVDDPASIVEDLNLSRYVTEDGDIDSDAITALRNKYARIVKRQGVGQGRSGAKPSASTADQFAEVLRGLGA